LSLWVRGVIALYSLNCDTPELEFELSGTGQLREKLKTSSGDFDSKAGFGNSNNEQRVDME